MKEVDQVIFTEGDQVMFTLIFYQVRESIISYMVRETLGIPHYSVVALVCKIFFGFVK